MKIAIATDHNGVEVKKEIKTFLKNKGHEVIDFSQHNSAIDDYQHAESDYVDQISLALAAAYIYDGQKSKAKDILNHILNDPDASPDVKEKAKQLLDSIKKTFIF